MLHFSWSFQIYHFFIWFKSLDGLLKFLERKLENKFKKFKQESCKHEVFLTPSPCKIFTYPPPTIYVNVSYWIIIVLIFGISYNWKKVTRYILIQMGKYNNNAIIEAPTRIPFKLKKIFAIFLTIRLHVIGI